MDSFVLVAGVAVAGLYILLALGFTLMVRIADIVNLAYGSFVVAGMYGTLVVVNSLGANQYVAAAAVVSASLPVAWLTYRYVIRHLLRQGHRWQIVFTLLLLGLLQNLFQVLFGSDVRTLDVRAVGWTILDAPLRRERAIAFLVAVAASILFFLIFKRTHWGKLLEGAGHNPEAARALGVDVNRLYSQVFVIGTAMAVLAGALIVGYTPVDPFLALHLLVIAVLISLTARLSFVGVVVAALVYGVGHQALLQLLGNPTAATVGIYLVFVAALVGVPWVRVVSARLVTAVR